MHGGRRRGARGCAPGHGLARHGARNVGAHTTIKNCALNFIETIAVRTAGAGASLKTLELKPTTIPRAPPLLQPPSAMPASIPAASFADLHIRSDSRQHVRAMQVARACRCRGGSCVTRCCGHTLRAARISRSLRVRERSAWNQGGEGKCVTPAVQPHEGSTVHSEPAQAVAASDFPRQSRRRHATSVRT